MTITPTFRSARLLTALVSSTTLLLACSGSEQDASTGVPAAQSPEPMGIGDGVIGASERESGTSAGSVELAEESASISADSASGISLGDATSMAAPVSPSDPSAEAPGPPSTPMGSVPGEIVVEDPPVDLPSPDFQAGSLTSGAWDDNMNFDWFTSFRKGFMDGQPSGAPDYGSKAHAQAHERWLENNSSREKLDISLVIDTTGSMGDELGYLQEEFQALASTIESTYANADQRWSLVLYRDEGDEYVVKYYDFRSDLDEFRELLTQQSHGGGGDTPEAPDQALEKAAELGWRAGEDTARMLFWVADAPHHSEKTEELVAAIETLAEQDVHVYPVASSGVDDLSEFSMRSAAQLTLGRYLFLTDDSGFGGSHAEPKIPCYYVTALDDAVLRMVDLELTGKSQLPKDSDIVRRVGAPDDSGTCEMSENRIAHAM